MENTVSAKLSPPKSWRVMVKTAGDHDWVGNGMRYGTEGAAREAGSSLFMRWTAVKEWEVQPSQDEPNA